MKDYMSNLLLADHKKRLKEALKMEQYFGYNAVYGVTIENVQWGKQLLEHIMRSYPGYRWVVQVRSDLIQVVNESLHMTWGFSVYQRNLDNDGKVIRRMAGELLSHFGLPAGPKNQELIDMIPKNGRGDCRLLKGVEA